MYPDPRVAKFVSANFRPVRVHVREQKDEFQRLGQRFDAQWTPTVLIIDSQGVERHRIEGFLPADEFLPQLEIGLAHAARMSGKFGDAEQRYRAIVDNYSAADVAPEALYWAGVSKYKGSNDAAALAETAQHFSKRYSDTAWAKKASVWRS